MAFAEVEEKTKKMEKRTRKSEICAMQTSKREEGDSFGRENSGEICVNLQREAKYTVCYYHHQSPAPLLILPPPPLLVKSTSSVALVSLLCRLRCRPTTGTICAPARRQPVYCLISSTNTHQRAIQWTTRQAYRSELLFCTFNVISGNLLRKTGAYCCFY